MVQKKNDDKDGYNAIQLGFEDQKEERLKKPERGHFKKASCFQKIIREFKVDKNDETSVGDSVDVSIFNEINFVDVVANGKGRFPRCC